MAAKRRRRKRSIVSTTDVPEQTGLPDDDEVTGVIVRTEPAFVHDETTFTPPEAPGAAVSEETTGRTWADVVYPYSSNRRYLYLMVLLLIVLVFGGTGHLATLNEALIAGISTVAGWIVLWFIQRRS